MAAIKELARRRSRVVGAHQSVFVPRPDATPLFYVYRGICCFSLSLSLFLRLPDKHSAELYIVGFILSNKFAIPRRSRSSRERYTVIRVRVGQPGRQTRRIINFSLALPSACRRKTKKVGRKKEKRRGRGASTYVESSRRARSLSEPT